MSIGVAVIIFIVGLIFIVKGGDWFVDAASWMARAANIPSFIIGATIVSFATTLPETIVSVVAAIQKKNDMAIGNAVGSVTANTALILALSMIFLPIIIKRKKYIKQCLLLIAAASFLWIGSLSGQLKIWASIILALLFITFMTTNVIDARGEMGASQRDPVNKKHLIRYLIMFVVGTAGIVIGSQFLVNGGSAIAAFLGIPERVVAVTMVAIGTSLPELVTTITAIRKKEAHLGIGNIIGANIIDLSLILPLCSAVSGTEFSVSAQALSFDLPFCLLVTLVALIPLLIRQKASKWQGGLMIGLYAAYLIFTL